MNNISFHTLVGVKAHGVPIFSPDKDWQEYYKQAKKENQLIYEELENPYLEKHLLK